MGIRVSRGYGWPAVGGLPLRRVIVIKQMIIDGPRVRGCLTSLNLAHCGRWRRLSQQADRPAGEWSEGATRIRMDRGAPSRGWRSVLRDQWRTVFVSVPPVWRSVTLSTV